MGRGTGGRGSFVPERRGRSLGRHPENGDSGREELTPYQELATEVGGDTRTRSQPPARRPDATHPMTTRQQAEPNLARSQVLDDPHYVSTNVEVNPSTGTDTHHTEQPQEGRPGLIEGMIATVSQALTGSPPTQTDRPPARILARDSTDSRDQNTDPSPNRTTLYEGSPAPTPQGDGAAALPPPYNPGSDLDGQPPVQSGTHGSHPGLVMNDAYVSQYGIRPWHIDPQDQARYNAERQAEEQRRLQRAHPGVPPYPPQNDMIESGIPPNYGLHAGMDPVMYRGDAAMHDAAMREAAAIAQQEEMWDDAQIAHNLDEQARLTEEHARAQAQAQDIARFDGRYHMRYSLPSRSTAQEDILRTLDQGRSNTAPGSLPGHTGPPRIPLGHPMPNV